MKKPFRTLLTAAVVLALNSPLSADIFIKFDDIDGEVTTPGYEGWSRVLSVGHELKLAEPSSGGIAQNRIDVGHVRCLKLLDKSSTKLAEALLLSQRIPDVTIDFTKPIGDGTDRSYYTIELTNVRLTRHDVQVEAGSGALREREEVSLAYEEITWTYRQWADDGTLIEEFEFGWDVPEEPS